MTKLPLYKYNPSHASHMKTKHLTLRSPPIHLSIFILKENLRVNSLLEIQQIQIELPTIIFHRYFAVIFTNRTFFITKIIGIYWQKQSIDIYWGNPRRNIKNKKTSYAMTCKFLWTILPMELQSNSNGDVRTVMCQKHWQHFRWSDKQNNSVDNSIGKFNIWLDIDPSLFLLFLPPASKQTPPHPPNINNQLPLTPPKISPHLNTNFSSLSIHVLIYYGFFIFSK
jgi:hypothetical protein